jgi:Fe-S cluster biosynthesis and repair protein YggX
VGWGKDRRKDIIMAEIVCRRTGKTVERMKESPYPGPLSDLIWNNVGEEAWQEWIEASLVLLNEYRLNLLDPKHADLYEKQMLKFLNLSDEEGLPKMQLTPTDPLKKTPPDKAE